MKILLICLLMILVFCILFGLYVLILFLRKELEFSRTQVEEGCFFTIGQRKRFWIVKDKRFVFKVLKGQIVSVRDLQKPFKLFKYGGEVHGDI